MVVRNVDLSEKFRRYSSLNSYRVYYKYFVNRVPVENKIFILNIIINQLFSDNIKYVFIFIKCYNYGLILLIKI